MEDLLCCATGLVIWTQATVPQDGQALEACDHTPNRLWTEENRPWTELRD